jgi:hypothetical protein
MDCHRKIDADTRDHSSPSKRYDRNSAAAERNDDPIAAERNDDPIAAERNDIPISASDTARACARPHREPRQ